MTEHSNSFRIHQLWAGAIVQSVKWLVVLGCCVCAAYAVSVLAGKTTAADISVDMSASGSLGSQQNGGNRVGVSGAAKVLDSFGKVDFTTNVLLVISNGLFLVLYQREKRLRKEKTIHFSHQVELYERILDPQRTSSNLTRDGETNPDDR